MHVYIYDSFLTNKRYSNLLAKIETRITDLGLNGKICRLGVIKNYADTIRNEISRGAKTIIAVGNDTTVSQVINSMYGSDVPFAIIPIGKENNLISHSLGIGLELEACDVLSARRVENVNLGKINSSYFLTEAKITTDNTILGIDQNFSIEISEPGEIKIINLPLEKNTLTVNGRFSPVDNTLELLIKTYGNKSFIKKTLGGESIFAFKKLSLENKNTSLLIDNAISVNLPAEISLASNNINIIVGKNRNF